jgi:apolipoprotein N-acyltransferase
MEAAVQSATPAGAMARFPWKIVAAVGSGLLLAAAFPPFGCAQLAWCALVPLLLALIRVAAAEPRQDSDETITPNGRNGLAYLREAFRLGYVCGAIFWLIGLSWLLRLLSTSPAPAVLILAGWLLLAAYCALYPALFAITAAWTIRGVGVKSWWQTLLLLLLLPVLWTGFDYLRAVLFGGFPWNELGVSQYASVLLIQCAEWVGVSGVTAMLALMNAAIALTVLRYLPPRQEGGYRPHVELFVGLMTTAFCIRVGFGQLREHVPESGTFRVAAVQPAIPQIKKWTEDEMDRIHTTLRHMTEAAVAGEEQPDLVIWPETATPLCVTEEGASQDLVRDLCRNGVPLLVGSMDVQDTNGTWRCFNSSFLFDGSGRVVTRYDKQHLVPFGEYIPLSGPLPWLAHLAPMGWNCIAGREATVFKAGPGAATFSCLICFEDIMPGLSRAAVRRGARLLINQTNDAWFDRTAGPLQHLSHSVFRCVENRVPLVRVANSGITCLIEPNGAVRDPTENSYADPPGPALRRWLVYAPPAEMPLTFYARYGDRLLALPCGGVAAVGLGFALAAAWRGRVRKALP